VVSLIIASALSHWFAARWLIRAFPRLRPQRVKVVALALAILPMSLRGLTHFTWSPWVTELLGVSMIELVTTVTGSVLLGLFYLVRRVLTRKRKATSTSTPTSTSTSTPTSTPTSTLTPTLTRRELVERVAGLAAYGSMGSMLGWGLVRGRHAFELNELVVKIPGLPRSLDGYVIAQVSDLHTGAFVTERELLEGFELVRAAKADLLVATGDLVDFEAGWAPLFARLFSDLPARDGHFAILGNHDYYADTSRVMLALNSARIDLLVNQGRRIRPQDGGGFSLLGVDDLWAPFAGGAGPDLDRALRDVSPDAPRILLAHQPKYVDRIAGQVALQLSGHTHGGQINPGVSPAKAFMKYVSGRYEVKGTTLYVNRGFGVAGPPSRIGAPPEITKVVLVSA
jgi:predicted MPP superfamily phosphohydrolase